MRDITQCHPQLQVLADKLVKECARQGLKIKITECLRTVSEQDALYAKGRTTAGSIVTNARGSSYSSMHQWGVAFDICRNDGKGAYNDADGFFSKVGKIGMSIGLEWGGSWTSPVDKPHYQLKDWGSGPAKLKAQYGSPDAFKKTWKAEQKKEDDEMVKYYENMNEIPAWAKPFVKELIDTGCIADKNKLHLSDDMLRTMAIMDRRNKK